MARQSIQKRFEAYHATHPNTYKLFVKYAKEMRAAGHRRYSADAILHRIRWHQDLEGPTPPSEHKLNDHFSSRYARKMTKEYPLFATFFELRDLRSP